MQFAISLCSVFKEPTLARRPEPPRPRKGANSKSTYLRGLVNPPTSTWTVSLSKTAASLSKTAAQPTARRGASGVERGVYSTEFTRRLFPPRSQTNWQGRTRGPVKCGPARRASAHRRPRAEPRCEHSRPQTSAGVLSGRRFKEATGGLDVSCRPAAGGTATGKTECRQARPPCQAPVRGSGGNPSPAPACGANTSRLPRTSQRSVSRRRIACG